MPNINDYLQEIKTSVYGEEVRDAIHDAIEQCYEDVNQQVSMIEAAGAAQITAVQAKGAETIETIPDNYDALGENVKNERDNVVSSYLANALPYFIKNTNVWTDSATGTHYMIPVAPGDKVIVRAKREIQTQYAVLRSFDVPVLNGTPDYSTATGFTARMTVNSDTSSSEFTVPSDGLYICANGTVTSSGTLYDYTPASITVNGVEVFSGTRSHIKNLQDRQSIFQSLSLKEIKRFDWFVDTVGRKYQPQSITVTDDYVVIGMNSVNTTEFPDVFDKYNAFLALDKTTLEPADLETNPVIIDFVNGGYVIAASHAGNMSYVASSNELWIRTMTTEALTNRYAIVLDADTLALKTFTQMPYSGAFGYDNQNGKWCFLQDDPNNSKKYYAREFESTRTTQVGVVSVWKQGTTQGCEFYDNAIFIPNSPPSNSQGNSLMMVDGSTGALLADWWFPNVNEFEDISFIDDQIVLLNATSSYGSLLVGAYKPYNRYRDDLIPYSYLWNSEIGLPISTSKAVDIMVSQPDISWTIGTTVAKNTGTYNYPYPTGAVSNEIPVAKGDIIVSNTPSKDSNGINLIVHLSQYADGVFQSRNELEYNKPVVFGASITSIRLNFLRAASANVNMTATDIEKYFNVSLYRKAASYLDYKRDSEQIETHTDAIGPLVNIAETWFNVAYDPNDQIVYETQHGPYSTLRDSNNKKAIVCSQFALACLSGLPYERSRYVQNDNAFCWWGYRSDGTGTYPYDNDYMINQYWVQYLADKGLLVPYVAGHHNIKAGDLLFYGNDIEHNGGHCRICTQVNPHQVVTMESTGEVTRKADGASVGLITKGINLETNPPTYYAHMPIAPTNYTTKRILLDTTHQTGSAAGESGVSSVEIKKYDLPTLERGFYTIVIDREESGTAGLYVRLYYPSSLCLPSQNTENILFGANDNYGGTIRSTFYAQVPLESIRIRCSFNSGSAYSYDITRVALYRGWHE